MKSKDQALLEEAYKSIHEAETSERSFATGEYETDPETGVRTAKYGGTLDKPTPVSTSKIYGLFHEVDYQGSALLGLYSTEEEANKARAQYMASELEDFSDEQKQKEQKYLEMQVIVRQLGIGQAPSSDFAS
jgi:hypothetical protein